MFKFTGESGSIKTSIQQVAIAFLLWRLALLIVAFVGLSLSAEYPGSYRHDSEWLFFDDNYFLNGFFRWDADWYDLIAREGYFSLQGERQGGATAFFPLYPLASRWLAPIFGSHLIAGLVISNFALFFALIVCSRIGLKFYKEPVIQKAIALILVFPSSFFSSIYYTEGLYFFLTAASLFYFFKRRFWTAGIFGLLACLTRPTGILLLIAMVLSIGWNWLLDRRRPSNSVLSLLLIPLGLVAYMAYLYFSAGDALIFSTSQAHWGRSLTFPLVPLIQALQTIHFSLPRDMINTQSLANWISAIAFLGIGIRMLIQNLKSKQDITLSLWVLLGVLLPLSTGSTDSMVRFCSVLFPAFFYFASKLKSELYFSWLVSFFFALQIVYLLGFMNKFWVV